MTLAQACSRWFFGAIIGGLGASLLPVMQSLIHGNFEGHKAAYALVGAATGIAAAIGPLVGGFITTYLSWRVGFFLEFVIIVIVLANIKIVKDAPYTGPREIDVVGSILSVVGMGGIVLSILAWQEGGERVGLLLAIGLLAMWLFARWLIRGKKLGKPILLDPELFSSKYFRMGATEQMLQNISLGGMMIVLPIYFQMVFEYTAMQTGLALAPFSLSLFAVALLAGRLAGKQRSSRLIQAGFAVLVGGVALLIPFVPRADSGFSMLIPLAITGVGLGLLVSQINNYTLSPISEERVSEAAGVNSAAGSFGLSFGLAFAGAIMLAAFLSFTNMAQASTVLAPTSRSKWRRRKKMPDHERPSSRATRRPAGGGSGRDHPHQHGGGMPCRSPLLVPLLAACSDAHSFRMVRPPDPEPSGAAEDGAGLNPLLVRRRSPWLAR
jgi:MFS family permease